MEASQAVALSAELVSKAKRWVGQAREHEARGEFVQADRCLDQALALDAEARELNKYATAITALENAARLVDAMEVEFAG